MSITIDQESLSAGDLGLETVGQLLGRLNEKNRLVVRLVIDGEAPNFNEFAAMAATPLLGRTIFVETADPRQVALETLTQVDEQLGEADLLKTQAADCLRANQWTDAMGHLAGSLKRWQEAQQAIVAVARLFRIDLERLAVAGRPLTELSVQFAAQLREIQTALQTGDLVNLTDLLVYETAQTGDQWKAAIFALRMMISPLQHVQSAA